jgi:hypothetical protein
VGLIVLNQAVAAKVPDIDAAITPTASQTSSFWMELDRVHNPWMLVERMKEFPLLNIP